MKLHSFSLWEVEAASFSKEQTEILKGIGILLIVLHNIFHNMTPVIGENEFIYHSATFSKFCLTIVENPFELIRAVLSYFGHYGVQIFMFFSTYGLTRKYFGYNLEIGPFFSGRIEKIYISFLICLFVYIILGFVKSEFMSSEKVFYWDSILWKVLLISSFIPNQALMPVGPWWFIPFIFQVYLFYPLLLETYRKYGNVFLLVISLASILANLFLNPYLKKYGLNINYMVFGHLPVLCMGIYLAAQEKIRLRADFFALSFVLFVLGNFNPYFWVMEGPTFVFIVLFVSIHIFNRCAGRVYIATLLIFFGGISFHLFMVNGFLRSPFHNFAESHNIWWIDNLAALASLLFSTLFAMALRMLDKKIREAFLLLRS